MQVGALLDVQLEIAVMRSLVTRRFRHPFRSPANLANRIVAAHAVPRLREIVRDEVAGNDAAAAQPAIEGRALFVRPDDDLERVAREMVAFAQHLDGFNGRERAEIAVEVASLWNRVDMRAEQNRLQCAIASFTAREDVAGGVDAR